ncbi:hydrolase [Motiliproteus sp. MSK22-1]|uniref:hydrolase n=1 Tax=Motiliproteus sp. MSK22-1 TaxID=1897630 RepID=UPI0009759AF8|nr:hydrolase [Motiliproteus sp. MSK22-1]OMH30088.1 acetylornithine deacetylase [Motiliproteus sp. MSK22-1]
MSTDFTPWIDWLDGQYQEMLSKTIELANINSGSLNAAGVNRVGEVLAQYCRETLDVEVEALEVSPYEQVGDDGEKRYLELGKAIRLGKRPDAPLQIFFCAHLDTVFAIDHPFQEVRWLDGETVNGPGVTDLKGGILVLLNALRALERTPWAEQIGWEILFNPDEEIGSPGSAPLIAEAATRCHLGLIYEPSFPDGNLAGARKGSGNFSVVVGGKSAHAGREHHLGRNAIRAMSDFISALDDLNGQREGVTINPGFIQGGGAVNAVPDRCMSRFNIRLERPEDEHWCLEHLSTLSEEINSRDGITLELSGGFGRKPKVITPANQKLLELVRDCGEDLGMTLQWLPTGGCCDGNNLSAAGIPNVDTLGVRGGDIHSSSEYLKVQSLTERAKLSALLLMKLATSNDLSWLNNVASENDLTEQDRL